MESFHATYVDGVLKPSSPLPLADGAEVEVTVVSCEVAVAPQPIAQVESQLQQLAEKVPAAEWEMLPCDLTDRLDHYLYGSSGE
jgi:predicted DNA-binding antitoxin AbrB/MazE fold protein